VHGADDLLGVYALQINARDSEVGVTQLPLDHVDRNALSRHLDGMSMPQLMGGKAPANASLRCNPTEALAS
jgi:hypothetical protein